MALSFAGATLSFAGANNAVKRVNASSPGGPEGYRARAEEYGETKKWQCREACITSLIRSRNSPANRLGLSDGCAIEDL